MEVNTNVEFDMARANPKSHSFTVMDRIEEKGCEYLHAMCTACELGEQQIKSKEGNLIETTRPTRSIRCDENILRLHVAMDDAVCM